MIIYRSIIKNIVILLSGNFLSQIIPFIFSPIISRIYNSEQFAIFGLFSSLVSILNGISFLRYEQTILISEDEKEIKNNFLYSVIVNFIFIIFIEFFVVILFKNINNIFEIGYLIYIAPIVVLITGVHTALENLKIRLGEYNKVSFSKVIKSLTQTIFQALFGIAKATSVNGLILGNILGLAISIPNLVDRQIKNYLIKYTSFKDFLVKYKNLPLYFLPGSLLNVIALNITTVLLNNIYSKIEVGYYTFSIRYLGIPVVLIGDAIQKTFIRQAKIEHIEKGNTKITFLLFLKMLALTLPIFVLLFIFSPSIFKILFGNNWLPAGYLIRILLPMYTINFLYSPISGIIIIYKKEKVFFIFQFILLILTMVPYILTKYIKINFTDYLLIYSISTSFAYFMMLSYCFYINFLNKTSKKYE